jgi:predicted ATP-grasp superfamily ATP-dependent carboligase
MTNTSINNNRGAIVIGGHFHSLGLIRGLAERGVKVVLLDHEPCISRFSNKVWKYFKCPEVKYEGKFLSFLIHLATNKNLKNWVIFPSDDDTIHFLAKNKAELEKFYSVTTPKWDIIKYVYDKKYTYRTAEKMGMKIPTTFYPKNIDELLSFDLSYPCIIKPAVMSKFVKITGKKVLRANNRDHLIEQYQKACSIIDPEEILVQDEIPEVARNLYSFCPWFKEKKVLARIIEIYLC